MIYLTGLDCLQLVFCLLSTSFFSTFWYDSDDYDDGDAGDDGGHGGRGHDHDHADNDNSHFTYLANFQIVRRLSYKVNRILQLKNVFNLNKYLILNSYGMGQNKQPEMMLEPQLI